LLLFAFPVSLYAKIEKKIEKYYGAVQKAEAFIIKGDFHSALKQYKIAFRNNEHPFTADLYNASICAVNCGNSKIGMEWCWALSQKGVGDSFFLNNQVLSKLSNQEKWD